MLKRIKSEVIDNRNMHKTNANKLQEIYWANVYHDSIRGRKGFETLALNIGRWAGSYPFFYVLNRILFDYKPNNIIEFGLGESTKFISTFIEHHHPSHHFVMEQDQQWVDHFSANFNLHKHVQIAVSPLQQEVIHGCAVNVYTDIHRFVSGKFDLYIVDGPYGSEHFSRYDIVKLAESFEASDEFIIILDDYNRKGEQDTAKALMALFTQKNILIHKGLYQGEKSVLILATDKYKYTKTL
ncbi:hypothetical protein GCM10022386_12210 [Flavobacterium cheonhonense]|jgi:hypothetical protein|uniref:Class I SAM-dependent methyltransferase n=1 Tax=Flavobacterium cheonhonense TaxID=706185 RepID=A0ABP7TSP1_9FLAO|nr:hypothetical protein [Flavobacterium cheonhonense]